VNLGQLKMCTIKKTLEPISVNIFACIHIKNKQKNEIPFLPLFTFPAHFNNICPKKWFTALVGKRM
jgi:hypothetical protein